MFESDVSSVRRAYQEGLALAATGDFFAAHEAFEQAWRTCAAEERDFFQGLVHVTVAWYQAGRGNKVGCGRQLEKAARRLGPFAPEHRGVDVASLLGQVAAVDPELLPFPALEVVQAEG